MEERVIANGSPMKARRDIVFLSKATPGDDEFALWLAPRLEEHGYTVFADILALEPGDRWRREITGALQNRAAKMLLCCRDSTLAKEGVQEEIGIGLDLAKELKDPRFLIPLRLEPYRKLFGIGELQYVDFARGWAEGLAKLLDGLRRQGVARSDSPAINPSWEAYRRRGAVAVREEPERLTSNWLRVASAPDVIRYFEPSGRVDRAAIARACDRAQYPTVPVHAGFLSFGTAEEVHRLLGGLGRFEPVHQWDMLAFKENGAAEIGLQRNDASNIVTSMFRQAWNAHCRKLGLFERAYAAAVGFHASGGLVKVGEKVPWGRQGDRRSSMLRNVAKGHVWEFGVTAIPSFWPYPHFRLRARVLFSPAQDGSGRPYDDHKKQHRLRRSVCKGWRNKQWHGRLMAFIELLSGESPFIDVPLSEGSRIRLDAAPILFSSPVRTALPNRLRDEDEEEDPSTLGRPDPDEET